MSGEGERRTVSPGTGFPLDSREGSTDSPETAKAHPRTETTWSSSAGARREEAMSAKRAIPASLPVRLLSERTGSSPSSVEAARSRVATGCARTFSRAAGASTGIIVARGGPQESTPTAQASFTSLATRI